MKRVVWTAPLLLPVLLAGCIQLAPTREEPEYRPTFGTLDQIPVATDGAVYRDGHGIMLFSDRRAMRVGDVVTIRLEERTSSSKSSATTMSKKSESELPDPTVLGQVISGTTAAAGFISNIDSERDFEGSADSDQSNRLSGTLTATVAAVYPNGLMLVQGEKWLNLNRGQEYVRVSGLVRGEDIDGDNTVSSLRLADARIAYSGTGELADTSRAGWLTRFFMSPYMPF